MKNQYLFVTSFLVAVFTSHVVRGQVGSTKQDERKPGSTTPLGEKAASIASYAKEDINPFVPSSAIYFMDGISQATVKLQQPKQEITMRWHDNATSIAASAPVIPNKMRIEDGAFLVAPEPLRSWAHFPSGVPPAYKEGKAMQLLQVISMNMRSDDGKSSLLIGLPYAQKYPQVFSREGFADGAKDAMSFGVVSSIKDVPGENGFPARSCFAVYHILETEFGVYFNKKPTVMELQPTNDGKLALTLPPIPFRYELVNGPIPLYDIRNPEGPPIGEVVAAHHESSSHVRAIEKGSWPWRN